MSRGFSATADLVSNAWFPPFRCRSSVAVSPFCRCKIPLFCKNYVRKFRSVTAANSEKDMQRKRCTATAKRQRKNGNGLVETGHNWASVKNEDNGSMVVDMTWVKLFITLSH